MKSSGIFLLGPFDSSMFVIAAGLYAALYYYNLKPFCFKNSGSESNRAELHFI
jgi:hypothetical protein